MGLISIGIIYYKVSPEGALWMPKCPWFMITGTYCPSCGTQRMLHALLNGDIIKALQFNLFLVISLPYALLAVLGKWYNFNGIFNSTNKFIYSRKSLIAYVIIFFAWWATRIIFNI